MHKEKILNDFKSSNQLINDIVKIGETFLINQGIENAKNEIRWYLQKLYKCDSINLLNI